MPSPLNSGGVALKIQRHNPLARGEVDIAPTPIIRAHVDDGIQAVAERRSGICQRFVADRQDAEDPSLDVEGVTHASTSRLAPARLDRTAAASDLNTNQRQVGGDKAGHSDVECHGTSPDKAGIAAGEEQRLSGPKVYRK